MKEADTIYARVEYVICPYCEAELYDWLRDPRGLSVFCDECKKEFLVPVNANIVIS